MFIIEKKQNESFIMQAKEINATAANAMTSDLAIKILNYLSIKSSYPKNIAKELKIHEQKIYYHIKRLEKEGIIKRTKTEFLNGATANMYELTEKAFVLKFGELVPSRKDFTSKETSVLEPFISNGRLDCLIVVGSPDPHGPNKARAKDGYYAIDLGLFFGSFLSNVDTVNVKLDTDILESDLNNNFILVGGPIVNAITAKVNSHLPIYFDESNCIFSKFSENKYYSEHSGLICKINSPFNKNKKVLVIAGKRTAGTKAAIVAFIKYFNELAKGNLIKKSEFCKVVDGLDLDSDGKIDDVEIRE